MRHTAKLGLVLVAAGALSACTSPAVQDNKNTLTGVGLGGAIGAIVGSKVASDDDRGRRIGGILGAVAGGALGAQLDEQERALRGDLGGSGAMIQNTGEQLIVTLPESITFDFNSSTVNPRFVGTLNQLAGNLNQYPNSRIQIIGHTDNIGGPQFNNQLSLSRAQAVAGVLTRAGVNGGRISTGGDGEFNPIASNSTSAGRAQNRRVEITITPM